jgi:hypothetical protein
LSESPAHIGPCEFGMLGRQITVRCPRQFDALKRGAGGQWGAASRRWLIERRCIWPVIRTLQRRTDSLFRREPALKARWRASARLSQPYLTRSWPNIGETEAAS